MQQTRRAGVVCVLVTLAVQCALSLASAQPTQSIPSGGQIVGHVVEDTSSAPLPDVQVFLHPQAALPGRPASVSTDQSGTFTFLAVPPGSYRLGTNKSGFFPTENIGSARVTVADNEQVTVALTMSKGGTVAGRLLDESGRPLQNMWVGALRVVAGEELWQAHPAGTVARTDVFGRYRVESLSPGEHVIVANTGHGPIGAAAGGITDSITYFPSTLEFAKARRVMVGPAQTVLGLDITMMRAPTFEVSGLVVDDDGHPCIGLIVALDADWALFGGPKGRSRTDSEGRFRLPGIAAGRYALRVTNPDSAFTGIDVVDANITGLVVVSHNH